MPLRNRKQLIICVSAAVLVLGFILLRYLPMHKKLASIHRDIADRQAGIDLASAQEQQFDSLVSQMQKLKVQVSNYQENIPTERDLGGFLQLIAKLMNEHDLKEQQVQPGEEIKADQLNCIPITMNCKGELNQVFSFFESLQGLERSVRIEHVKLTNEKDFSGIVNLQTKAIIYYRNKS